MLDLCLMHYLLSSDGKAMRHSWTYSKNTGQFVNIQKWLFKVFMNIFVFLQFGWKFAKNKKIRLYNWIGKNVTLLLIYNYQYTWFLLSIWCLTFLAPISQNGQTHSNNSSGICRWIVWVCLTILWDWCLKR